MATKHRVSRSEALGRIATLKPVEVAQSAPRETLKAFQHRYESEQEAQRTAPIRAAVQEYSATLRHLAEQDAPTLYVTESAFLAATAPQFVDGQCDGIPMESIKASVRRAYSEAEDTIRREGNLTEPGRQKLQNLSHCNLSTDWLQASAWVQAYRLLRLVGELTDEDFVGTPASQPQESPVDVDATIEAMNCELPENRKRAEVLLAGQLFGADGKAVFQEWVSSLSAFDFSPSEADQRKAIDLFVERNWSFLDRRCFDSCRKVMVARGIFPERCLTNADRAEILVENSPAQTYTEKQELKRKLAALSR